MLVEALEPEGEPADAGLEERDAQLRETVQDAAHRECIAPIRRQSLRNPAYQTLAPAAPSALPDPDVPLRSLKYEADKRVVKKAPTPPGAQLGGTLPRRSSARELRPIDCPGGVLMTRSSVHRAGHRRPWIGVRLGLPFVVWPLAGCSPAVRMRYWTATRVRWTKRPISL